MGSRRAALLRHQRAGDALTLLRSLTNNTGTDQADCFPKEKIMPAAPLKDAVSGYFSRNLVVNTSMYAP